MKSIITLCLISLNSFATEYLIYANKRNFLNIQSDLKSSKDVRSIKLVFSKQEQKLLNKTSINPYILKVNILKNDEFIIKSLISRFDITIELNQVYKNLSDSYNDLQWGLKNDGSPLKEWLSDIDLKVTEGKAGEDINNDLIEKDNKITVAVIDSGIDVNHPDLKENIFFKEKECESLNEYNKCLNSSSDKNSCHAKYANIDNDQNGYPLDCHGWNFAGKLNDHTGLQGDQKVFDNVGHGTHIAGIIGAVKNDIGINGIIQNVKLLPVQVSGSNRQVALKPGETTTDIFAKGLLYAIKSGAQVINLSVGWSLGEDSLLMRQLIKFAHKNNILIIAAGGNSHHAAPTYPCSYEDVICVGSHSVDGKLSSFSNFGPSIDIVAPGTKILSTYPIHKRAKGFTQDKGYEYMSGTSQAAPFVTAAAAKLLNQGFTPKEVRVKLLSGSRGKVQQYIRHANLDIKKANSTVVKSFLYPLNKSPLLINWNKEEKSFKLKVKNYGEDVKSTVLTLNELTSSTQESISLITKEFFIQEWSSGETKEFSIKFTSEDDIESDIYFKLFVKNKDEDKSYIIQAQALTIITPDYQASNTDIFNITGEKLSGYTLKPFDDFNAGLFKDFIGIKQEKENTSIVIVKARDESYVTSSPLKLPIKDPIFLKFSKVDLDLNGESEYVITLIDNYQNSKERITKFFILNKDFKVFRYLISPKNQYDNKLSVLPGSFIWIKYKGSKVPAWIGYGKRPLNQRIAATPWQDTPFEYSRFYLYLLTKDGLKAIELKDSQFVSFLYQNSDEKKNGTVKLITSKGLGFYKTYSLYNLNERLEYISEIKLSRYHDLLGTRPLPINSMNFSNAFFFTPSVEGAQNVTMIWSDKNVATSSIKVPSFSKYDPISFILSANEKRFIFQTRYHLGLYDKESDTISKIESKVNSKRIRHELLNYSDALFLNSSMTPGIASEVISVKSNIIYRSSLWRMLGAKGCESIGLIQEEQKDKLVFLCSNDSKLIKICY